MSTKYKRLKGIDKRTELLIDGFLRECQHNLFGELMNINPYYNIPKLVNNHCMLFYETLVWHTKHVGTDIEFTSNRIVKKTQCSGGWSTCMFDNEISKDTCNKFMITFKINAFGSTEATEYKYPNFYFGWTTGETLKESIKTWNQQLGEQKNKMSSVSWCIYTKSIHLSDKDRYFQSITKNLYEYEIGDRFTVRFDFIKKKVGLYYNDDESAADERDLGTDKLWIGFSFYFKNEIIEVIDHCYE